MLFVCTFIFLYLIVVGLPALSYSRMVGNPRLGLYFSKLLARMMLFVGGVRLTVRGLEKLESDRGYVYVGNHRSHVDMAVVFKTVPGDVRFLIKKEAYRVPLFGFAFHSLGMIQVDRTNAEAAARSIDHAVREIQHGRSIILFPEGTRSRRRGEILRFKKGAFVLAIKSQVPIVPFTLIGADDALPPDSIRLYGGDVQLIFHDPIETTGLTLEHRDRLLNEARQKVEQAFKSAI